jgi:hypothetical protein
VCLGGVFFVAAGWVASVPLWLGAGAVVDGVAAGAGVAAGGVVSCATTGPTAISNESTAAAPRCTAPEPGNDNDRPRIIPLYAGLDASAAHGEPLWLPNAVAPRSRGPMRGIRRSKASTERFLPRRSSTAAPSVQTAANPATRMSTFHCRRSLCRREKTQPHID